MANSLVIKSSSRQRFNDEEKKKIVEQFFQSGLGHNEFCRKVAINPGSLTQWRDKFSQSLTLLTSHTPTEELSALEKENLSLKTELLNLKQAFGNKLVELEMRTYGA